MHPPVLLVVAIPVMEVEGLLALNHRSADEAPPVLPSQDLGTKPRRRLQGQLAVTVLKVRRPRRIKGVGVPFDLDVALRFDHLPNPDEPFPGGWIGEPPGFPRLLGKVALGYPVPGLVRVAQLRPPIEPAPDEVVESGAGLAADDVAAIVRPPPQHGVQGRDALGRGVSRGLLTARFDPRLECLEADPAGCTLELAQWAVGSLLLAARLPSEVEALCAGRDDGFHR
jgi:hypothetical protein